MYFEYFLLIHQIDAKWTAEKVGNGVKYLKSNKNWCVGVFKCLDHDGMVRSRICTCKDVNLSNMLFSVIHFAYV